MAKFIIRLLVFILIAVTTVAGISIFNRRPLDPSDYMAAIIEKHNRIVSTSPPRMLFAGGSNLTFGLNSEKIEDTYGLPVINLSLHAGLGLRYILNELKYSIKPNDIVFLSVEYLLEEVDDYGLMKNTGRYFPEATRFYKKNYILEIKTLIKNIRNEFRSLFTVRAESVGQDVTNQIYSRNSFNRYGDLISHLNQPGREEIVNPGVLNYRYWEGIELINEFNDFAVSQDVKVYFLFPNFPASQYIENKSVIHQIEKDIRANLEVQILNTPEDFVYPDSMFFDFRYHLNRVGREKRTEKMIVLIDSVQVTGKK